MATVKRRAKPKKTYEVTLSLTDGAGSRAAQRLVKRLHLSEASIDDDTDSVLDAMLVELGVDPDEFSDADLGITAFSLSIREIA